MRTRLPKICPSAAVVVVQWLEEGVDVEVAGLIGHRELVGLGEDVAVVRAIISLANEPFAGKSRGWSADR